MSKNNENILLTSSQLYVILDYQLNKQYHNKGVIRMTSVCMHKVSKIVVNTHWLTTANTYVKTFWITDSNNNVTEIVLFPDEARNKLKVVVKK